MTHPVFKIAPIGTKTIYVWDDRYLQTANYSFKRLIFIYETLCELSIDIIRDDTVNIIQQIAPSTLYVPATNNPLIVSIINDLKIVTNIEIVEDEMFAVIKKPNDLRRFFPYWKEAEKTALQQDGGI